MESNYSCWEHKAIFVMKLKTHFNIFFPDHGSVVIIMSAFTSLIFVFESIYLFHQCFKRKKKSGSKVLYVNVVVNTLQTNISINLSELFLIYY